MCWLAGDVETEGVELFFIQTYLLFSLLQRLWHPWNQNRLKVLPFWKICLLSPFTVYRLSTSHTQTQPGIFTWCLGLICLCLVRYTLDEFGTARRSAVVRGFIDALTRGGPGGTPRPIEMHSHDPMRYRRNRKLCQNIVWLHRIHTLFLGWRDVECVFCREGSIQSCTRGRFTMLMLQLRQAGIH